LLFPICSDSGSFNVFLYGFVLNCFRLGAFHQLLFLCYGVSSTPCSWDLVIFALEFAPPLCVRFRFPDSGLAMALALLQWLPLDLFGVFGGAFLLGGKVMEYLCSKI